jgi:hypothetical protein
MFMTFLMILSVLMATLAILHGYLMVVGRTTWEVMTRKENKQYGVFKNVTDYWVYGCCKK